MAGRTGETGELSGRRAPTAVRGTAHHGLVLGAAGLAVLLAATVLAALAALTEKAVEGGIQRRLARDPGAVVEVSERTGRAVRVKSMVSYALLSTVPSVAYRITPGPRYGSRPAGPPRSV